jgi:hypothetical protein
MTAGQAVQAAFLAPEACSTAALVAFRGAQALAIEDTCKPTLANLLLAPSFRRKFLRFVLLHILHASAHIARQLDYRSCARCS